MMIYFVQDPLLISPPPSDTAVCGELVNSTQLFGVQNQVIPTTSAPIVITVESPSNKATLGTVIGESAVIGIVLLAIGGKLWKDSKNKSQDRYLISSNKVPKEGTEQGIELNAAYLLQSQKPVQDES